MSSSSFLSSIRQCDVFVSFRGADTRKNFISHLYRSLDQKGIRTFKDTTVLDTDTFHSNELVRAIKECRVAVVVMSENYSSSFWCLQDLVMILQFHHERGLIVIPVFYGVRPSEARRQTGKVGMHFSEHAVKYPKYVHVWRSSLTELANIAGEDSKNWESDAELVDSITHKILDTLRTSSSMDFSGLVGMDHHMEAMLRLLDLEHNNETCKIGIWGEGGVGKTTVARYVYDEISRQFDAHIFLNNVKEIYQSDGSWGLHKALVSEYLKGRAPMLSDVIIRETLRDQKVLLIADNVDQLDQFDVIAKEIDLVGPGSRVIITTQDRQSLIACGVRLMYEVKCLRFPEALKLFSLCAFKQNHPFVGFEELSDRAVKLAGGFPRAILAIGSRLYGRGTEEWGMILYRYEVSVLQSITETRKSSFDRSDFRDKSITGTLRNSENLIGMEYHMQALQTFLDLESNQLRIIGIWGMGGIGKTSLARHIFNEISSHFHSYVFLENIGKMYQDHGPMRLEEEFLSKDIEREVLTTWDSRGNSDVIKSRLGHRKILFVADGVDNVKQLKDVQKMATLFGPGSRVIVTTQEESLLVANGVKHVYEVQCLRFGEALQLFYQFAFKQQTPSTRFKQLSVHAIELVGSLPLALKVLGSFLCGRTELDWVATMHILEANQGEDTIEEERQYRDAIEEPSQYREMIREAGQYTDTKDEFETSGDDDGNSIRILGDKDGQFTKRAND